MSRLLSDLRFALEQILSHRRVFGIALLSLTLGIGVNSAMFSVLNATLLRPAETYDPRDFVALGTAPKDSGRFPWGISHDNLVDLRDHAQSFSGVTASHNRGISLKRGEHFIPVTASFTFGNYFDLLGLRAPLGQLYMASQDDDIGSTPQVVLSHGFWAREFARDPQVVGQKFQLNGQSLTVVGIAPADYHGLEVNLRPDLWLPWNMHPLVAPDGMGLSGRRAIDIIAVARLAPGVSLAQARAEVEAMGQTLVKNYPQANEGRELGAMRFSDNPGRNELKTGMTALMSLATLILLIACANVANLMLSHARTRQGEIAIRRAVGAQNSDLLRQLLTESLVLALMAGCSGLIFSLWARDVLWDILCLTAPGMGNFQLSLDHRVLGFALLTSVGTTLLFGLSPALQLLRTDVRTLLQDNANTASGSGAHFRVRNLLISVQVALSLVALVGASYFIRDFERIRRLDLGFDPSGVLVATLDSEHLSLTETQSFELYRRVLDTVQAVPGVSRASLSVSAPMRDMEFKFTTFVDSGASTATAGQMHPWNAISSGYFATLGAEVLGRTFTANDDADSARVAIVSQSFADKYWPDQSPIGKQIRNHGMRDEPLEVVGVTRSFLYLPWYESPPPRVYVPLQQWPSIAGRLPPLQLITRAQPDVGIDALGLRSALKQLESELAVYAVAPLDPEDYHQSRRGGALILTLLGGLGLVLAGIGIHGLTSHTVQQKTRELGIRMVLGADSSRIVIHILARVGAYVGVGIVLGTTLSSLLFYSRPEDPSFTAAHSSPLLPALLSPITLLVGIAFLAGFVPAWRVSRTRPARILQK